MEKLGCVLLAHSVNQGKGQALKTAFKYIAQTNTELVALVCADADGQHTPNDILACLSSVKPNSLVLGSRCFDKHSSFNKHPCFDKHSSPSTHLQAENTVEIPLRSRIGNKVTCSIFKMLCGVDVSDTQTGLRAMDSNVMKKMLNVKGSRFEYEMNMLIETKEYDIEIIQVPISTIYIEENKTSHFNPLKDSLRIYSVFAKFLLSSLLGFAVDIITFTILFELLKLIPEFKWGIVTASIGARMVSSLVNYTVNKNSVFSRTTSSDSENKNYNSLIKYYILCIIQLGFSALLVNLLSIIVVIYEVFIKILVDTILFVISFQLQREWVFKNKRKKSC